jgi:hypothetical protein
MKATIRIESIEGRTAYVVYADGAVPVAFDWLSAAQIHCAIEGYEWEVDL